MPTPSYRLDTVDGSSADISGSGIRIARGFTAEYLDTSVDASSLIFQILGMAGFPTIGDPHPDPAYADALVSNVLVQGSLTDGVAGQVIYTTPGMGATPSAYTLTRSTRLVDSVESVLPDGTVVQCGNSVYGAHIDPHPTPIRVARPCSSYIAEGIRLGSPNYPGADYVGFVNDATFLGRGKGQLRIEEFTTSWSKYAGFHNFRCQLLGNILGRDWSTFIILYNGLVGKYVKVDPASVSASIGLPYAYGQLGINTEGFAHYGPYPLVSFSSIGL